VCAYNCVQLWYTIQHWTVRIIFPFIFQTIIPERTLSTGRKKEVMAACLMLHVSVCLCACLSVCLSVCVSVYMCNRCNSMALHSLYCADVPLRSCSLTHLLSLCLCLCTCLSVSVFCLCVVRASQRSLIVTSSQETFSSCQIIDVASLT